MLNHYTLISKFEKILGYHWNRVYTFNQLFFALNLLPTLTFPTNNWENVSETFPFSISAVSIILVQVIFQALVSGKFNNGKVNPCICQICNSRKIWLWELQNSKARYPLYPILRLFVWVSNQQCFTS